MKKQEVKNLSEAKKRIEEVLRKEKKVSPPIDVKPRSSNQKT
jgi:hypothetical protein